jgi:hypothetical protein
MEKSLALILLQFMYESTTLDFCDLCKEIGTIDGDLVIKQFGWTDIGLGKCGTGQYTRCQKCIDSRSQEIEESKALAAELRRKYNIGHGKWITRERNKETET